MTDPRIVAALACARERSHPYYAAAAFTLARAAGDTAAMQEALRLGAANYRPAARVYAWTEKRPCDCCGDDALWRLDSGGYRCEACRHIEAKPEQLTMFEMMEAA